MRDSEAMSLPLSYHLVQGIGSVLAILLLGVMVFFLLPRPERRSHLSRALDAGAVRGFPFFDVTTLLAATLSPGIIRSQFGADRRRIARRLSRAEARLRSTVPSSFGVTGDLTARQKALLELEQVAREAAHLQLGSDYLRTMERLCAYVRHEAPAKGAVAFPLPDWQPLADNATAAEKASHLAWRDVRFAHRSSSNARDWARARPPPRADIALALRILGRRSPEQRAFEARLADDATDDAIWVFDLPCPARPERGDPLLQTGPAHVALTETLDAWTQEMLRYRGFRPDLRGTNLQGADLSGLILSGCRLDGARLDGAILSDARLDGARLVRASLIGADLSNARLGGADLSETRMEAANLAGADLCGARLIRAELDWANLRIVRMQGADLSEARMEVASLYKAQLEHACLFRARLDGAVLTSSSLAGADLRQVRAIWANFAEAKMQTACLQGAVLDAADLRLADLSGADLGHARMTGANLYQTRLAGAVFCRTRLSGVTSAGTACFEGAVFKDMEGKDLALAPLRAGSDGIDSHGPHEAVAQSLEDWSTQRAEMEHAQMEDGSDLIDPA